MPIYTGREGYLPAITRYRQLGMALRVSLDDERDPNPATASGLQASLLEQVREDPELLLDAVDYVLNRLDYQYGTPPAAEMLEAILKLGGSVWGVQLEPQA